MKSIGGVGQLSRISRIILRTSPGAYGFWINARAHAFNISVFSFASRYPLARITLMSGLISLRRMNSSVPLSRANPISVSTSLISFLSTQSLLSIPCLGWIFGQLGYLVGNCPAIKDEASVREAFPTPCCNLPDFQLADSVKFVFLFLYDLIS